MKGVTHGAIRSDSLLVTKLDIPSPGENLVPRPRLVQRLDLITRHRLTLVAAPPGFGKTTLLSEWVESKDEARRMMDEETRKSPHPSSFIPARDPGVSDLHPFPVAWLSLDEGDNDPVRFWRYVTAALQNLGTGIGTRMPTPLRPRRTQRVDAILTPLISDLATLTENPVLGT